MLAQIYFKEQKIRTTLRETAMGL